MSRSRRKKKLTSGKEARRIARTLVGQPKPERVIPDKRKKPPKHKKELYEEGFQ